MVASVFKWKRIHVFPGETSDQTSAVLNRSAQQKNDCERKVTTRCWVSGFHFMWIWIQEVRFPGCWLGLGIEGEQQQ